MYLQSIQVDGFKSYSCKTTIGPFSPNFNCISGLNGSGKSNILDAITFVIGCKDLSLMRCSNLSDLIYKQGNAHIKRASVSLIFNNRDKTKSPTGFQQVDEIIITRIVSLPAKTKYLLNGNAINNVQISNLFASIGLNPSTPNNFIIFQGKITQIIKMKPSELSSLLKEAAGTLHYEQRKDAASKILYKKNLKVIEIKEQLDTQVLPKIKEYQRQRQQYLRVKQLAVDLEQQIKYCTDLEYSINLAEIAKLEQDLERIQQELSNSPFSNLEAQHKELQQEIKKCPVKVDEALESQYNKFILDQTTLTSELQCFQSDLEQLKLVKVDKSQFNHKSKLFAQHKQEHQHLESKYNQLHQQYQLSQSSNLQIDLERMNQLKAEAIQQKTALEAQLQLTKVDERYLNELEASKQRIEDNSNEYLQSNFNASIEDIEMICTSVIAQMKEPRRVAHPHPQIQQLQIDGVIGCVGNFISTKPEYLVCLSIAAGAKLKHCITTTLDVAKHVLKSVKFSQRQSFCPLNKLNIYSIPANKLNQIKNEYECFTHHDIVQSEYPTIMDYCFGNVIFCKDQSIASTIAYTHNVKCITLAGDVYDPSGTVSGGFNKNVILNDFYLYNQYFVGLNKFKQQQQQLSTLNTYKEQYMTCMNQLSPLKQQLLQQQSLQSNLKQQMDLIQQYSNTSTAVDVNEYKRVSKQYEASIKALTQMEKEMEAFENELDQLESSNEQMKKERSEIQNNINNLQKQLHDMDNSVVDAYQQAIHQQTLNNNKRQLLQNQINQIQQQLEQYQQQQQQYKRQLKAIQSDLKSRKSAVVKGGNVIPITSLDEATAKMHALEHQYNKEKMTVNSKIMGMIDVAEKQEVDLSKMMEQVLLDKVHIEEAMVVLDRQKLQAVKNTFEIVTVAFGNILREILPGSSARLTSQDVEQGCEMEIKLNGTIQKSELSGGQKSLTAIALILSLLQFKTSPLYILDEVDAALDLSHTENIGQLLKTKFTGSQFIVVSLKEGMFANADVLMKTRFKDGYSHVERIAAT